jgi:signal peptidase I
MGPSQIIIALLVIFIFIILPSIGLYKMFQKAGQPGWKGAIPILNQWYMIELTHKPKWWFFAQLIPVIGVLFSLGIYLEFMKCFGKYKLYQQFATVVFSFIYFPYIGYNKKDKFIGHAAGVALQGKKSTTREWIDAGLFAIIAATLIRTFLIEAYTIPSGSMEGTMLINDYLFVSKVSYGPRLPMTPIAIPLVHNTMPFFGGKSYIDGIQWDYHRLPGFGKVERNDVVVFNFPNNDTAMLDNPANDYYLDVRMSGREAVWNRTDIITRPVDKKENYIKRCVGISGDIIEVRDGIVFVNGKQGALFPHQRMDYRVMVKPGFAPLPNFIDDNHITYKGREEKTSALVMEMENETVPVFSKVEGVVSISPYVEVKGIVSPYPQDLVYPQNPALLKWNKDNYGPIMIPKKGTTINLSPENIAIYRRDIQVYEKNKFEVKEGKCFINDKEATQYTFKMNYYWLMGDNRHNSLDSRFWGFVPEDHVVGKASFVWLSYGNKADDGQPDAYTKKGIRWGRLLRPVSTLEQ